MNEDRFTDYWNHRIACPTCRRSRSAATSCKTGAELALAWFEAFAGGPRQDVREIARRQIEGTDVHHD